MKRLFSLLYNSFANISLWETYSDNGELKKKKIQFGAVVKRDAIL